MLFRSGKLPKPIIGDVISLIDKSKRSVRIVSKGKYLPTIQTFIGTEKMSAEELHDNADTVLDSVKSKVNDVNIKSVLIKLTMGKPVKVV